MRTQNPLGPEDQPDFNPSLTPEHPIWVTYWLTEGGSLEWLETFTESRDPKDCVKLRKKAMRKWLRRPVRLLYDGPRIGYNEDFEGYAEVVVLENAKNLSCVYTQLKGSCYEI